MTSNDINLARQSLLALSQVESPEEYIGSREITIKENVLLEEYLRYRENDSHLSVRLYLHDGKIKAYEIPTFPHGALSAAIIGLMFTWNHQDLRYGTDSTMIVGTNSAKEPDSWVRPIRRPRPSPGTQAANRLGGVYPTMVIEVGHTQSLPDLHQKATLYFSPQTTIQIVLVIKIFEPRVDNTITLITAKYLRTSPTPLIPVQVISFGTAEPYQPTINYITSNDGMGVPPNNFIGVGRHTDGNDYLACSRAGIPTYIMNIPAAELFDGDPNVPAEVANGFDLDLWKLQVTVRDEFNI